MEHLKILIVDDEINIRKMLTVCLEMEEYRVSSVSNFQDAVDECQRRIYDLAFIDLRLGAEDGLDLIPRFIQHSPWTRIVVITAYASVETAVEAMRRGASDYVPKPFTPTQIIISTRRVLELRFLERKVKELQESLGANDPSLLLSTASPAMKQALDVAKQAAPSEASILLRGESGTGKTQLARAIHSWSGRARQAFATVSCPSLSAELLESELFGHVKGAFTGAIKDQPGKIGTCEGGTLFLDEVGDLPSSIQPKLLRFIQDHEYERVGDPRTRQADVRILALYHGLGNLPEPKLVHKFL
ncbi:MAG: response regulator [bacterium]|nr:response regulator [bacterium]